jgi:hypothetical protein
LDPKVGEFSIVGLTATGDEDVHGVVDDLGLVAVVLVEDAEASLLNGGGPQGLASCQLEEGDGTGTTDTVGGPRRRYPPTFGVFRKKRET